MTTAATGLADLMLRIRLAQAGALPDLDDPNGDEARGIDPDALYDQTREDHL